MEKIKKKHVINTGIILILFVFCIGPILTALNDDSYNNTQMELKSLHSSGSGITVLNTNEYVSTYMGYLSTSDGVYWSFSSSDSNVGITVRAMTSTEYSKFTASQSYSYYSLSGGYYSSDSGTWSPSSSSSYYIVFINFDSTGSSTVTWSATETYIPYNPFDIFGSFFAMMSIGIIITVVVAIIIIVVIVVAIRRNTSSTNIKKSPYRSSMSQTQMTPAPTTPVYQQAAASTTSKPEQTKANIGYCRYCGGKTEVDASFCPQCGSKL